MQHLSRSRCARMVVPRNAVMGRAQLSNLRTFSSSRLARDSAADLTRFRAVGAKEETRDITAMDKLLRVSRHHVNPQFQHLLPVRNNAKWLDTLHAIQTPVAPPKTNSQPLTPRKMSDSYCEIILPFASSPDLLETYTNTSGGIRTGMLMEHLDSLAGSIAYKHMLEPGVNEVPKDRNFYIVTASVDRLDMLGPLYPVRDLRLSGQVIHVGRSSMEIAVRMETLDRDGTEETVMLGRFCMVCRSTGTNTATPVNPLLITTPEDEALRNIGEAHKNRRTSHTLRSLSRVPPSSSEAEALHALYLQSTIPSASASESASQPLVDERVPMGQTRLEKTMMMYPQERNVHGKIFGGYLMRLAYELGYSNAMLFMRGPVRFLSLDNISFARPVPIGSVLRLTSYILHTSHNAAYPALIHVGVKASVVDVRTGKEQMTNDFRFTWCREEGEILRRKVVPMTYQESMLWIEGLRALELGAEIRELRHAKRGVSAP